jgi:hypothetical protein
VLLLALAPSPTAVAARKASRRAHPSMQ